MFIISSNYCCLLSTYPVNSSVQQIEQIDKKLTIDNYKKLLIKFVQDLLNFVKINSTNEERVTTMDYINIKIAEFAKPKQSKKDKAETKNKQKYLKYKMKYINYKNQIV
jgi:hypothetical protein